MRVQVVNGDYGMFQLVNVSYTNCCCNKDFCPPGSTYCWLPRDSAFPCQDVGTFGTWLKQYIDERIEPVAVLALCLCLLQFFSAVFACCNQCQGKKQAEKDKIAGAMSYDGMDGMYGDQESGGSASGFSAADGAYGKWAGQGGRPGSAAVVQPPPAAAARAPGPPKPARANIGAPPGAAGAGANAGPKV